MTNKVEVLFRRSADEMSSIAVSKTSASIDTSLMR